MTRTGSPEPRPPRRRLRTVTDVVAATMIAAGAVLAGVSVSQHEHRDHALAAQAARKAEVDRAAAAEAEQFRAMTLSAANKVNAAGADHMVPTVQAPPFQRAALVLPASRLATDRPAARAAGRPPADQPAKPQAAARVASRHPAPARPKPPAVTRRGAVSEVSGKGATLVIPALRVRAPVVAAGAVDGLMTIPADVHTVAWFDGSDVSGGVATSDHAPWPGQPGVSLLAGHVDWVGQGPGALYYIGQLVAGDPIEVVGTNRQTTYWRVSQPPITIAKSELPQTLFNNSGPPKLALVTCGGPFDAATGHYLDNVIVWATLTTR
jgi:Sortase domain